MLEKIKDFINKMEYSQERFGEIYSIPNVKYESFKTLQHEVANSLKGLAGFYRHDNKTIYVNTDTTDNNDPFEKMEVLSHELVHLLQHKLYGEMFSKYYELETKANGYHKNVFEREARFISKVLTRHFSPLNDFSKEDIMEVGNGINQLLQQGTY